MGVQVIALLLMVVWCYFVRLDHTVCRYVMGGSGDDAGDCCDIYKLCPYLLRNLGCESMCTLIRVRILMIGMLDFLWRVCFCSQASEGNIVHWYSIGHVL